MSSFWNKLAACVLALTAAVAGVAMPVEAGWEQAGTEWRYTDESGENAADGFQWIDGSWYFFDSSGTMRTGWEKEGGKWYYFSASGRMVTGWLKQGENWYYLNSKGAMQTGWLLRMRLMRTSATFSPRCCFTKSTTKVLALFLASASAFSSSPSSFLVR